MDNVFTKVWISRIDFASHRSLDFEEMIMKSESFSKESFRYGIHLL